MPNPRLKPATKDCKPASADPNHRTSTYKLGCHDHVYSCAQPSPAPATTLSLYHANQANSNCAAFSFALILQLCRASNSTSSNRRWSVKGEALPLSRRSVLWKHSFPSFFLRLLFLSFV
ncbi:hypothetical protein E2542_SST09848 [Spatholobus suberectus]|nr:hypothetical protein E2542_SST09848 [Spatholobus suberectus]